MPDRDDSGHIDLDQPPSRWHVLTGHVQAMLLQQAVFNERQQREHTLNTEIKADIHKVGLEVAKLTEGQIRLEGRVDTVERSHEDMQTTVKWVAFAIIGTVIAAVLRLVLAGVKP